MTAICPAGPPKVCNEIANHARVSSPERHHIFHSR